MTYSQDFREKVIQIKTKEKLGIKKTAKRFGIGSTTLANWLRGKIPKNSRRKTSTKIDMTTLASDVKEYSDAYGYERAMRLGCSKSGVWFALKRLGITYKKSSKACQGKRRRQANILSNN